MNKKINVSEIIESDVIQIEITQSNDKRLTHHTGYVLFNGDNRLDFFSIELGSVIVVNYQEIVALEYSSFDLSLHQQASMVLLAEEYEISQREKASLQKFESIVDADFSTVSEKKMQDAFEKEAQYFADPLALPTSVKFYTEDSIPNSICVSISFSEQVFDQNEIDFISTEKAFRNYKKAIIEQINWHTSRCINLTSSSIPTFCYQDISYETNFLTYGRIGLSTNLKIIIGLKDIPLGVMNHFVQSLEKENAIFLNAVWRFTKNEKDKKESNKTLTAV